MQNETTTRIQIKEDLNGPIAAFNSILIPKLPFQIHGVFTLDTLQAIAELMEGFQSNLQKIFDDMPNDTGRVFGKLFDGEEIDRIDNVQDWISEDMSEDIYGGHATFLTKLAFHAGLTTEQEVRMPNNKPAQKPQLVKEEDEDDRRVMEDVGSLELIGYLSTVIDYTKAEELSNHMNSIGEPTVPPLVMTGKRLQDIARHYDRIGRRELRDVQECLLIWYYPNEFKVNDFEPPLRNK